VKVLDFGLAKALAVEQADLNLSNSPTLSNAATQQGIILGTAAYMSPEQSSRQVCRQKGRHLVFRRGLIRDVDWAAIVYGRNGFGHSGCRPDEGPGMG